ncbi:hypothetical protein WMF45_26435 [Sorangium sp. So ce448]|uniref:hypothetical protein n=1 Tax=Sorangium sp. So ce448 TaxID=3133314 RepID=UPI003F643219
MRITKRAGRAIVAMALWTGCAPELYLSEAEDGSGGGGGGGGAPGAPQGEVMWARALGGDSDQAGPSVAVAGDGAAALLGRLAGDVKLDEERVSAIGGDNVFLARVAGSDGAGLGLRRFGAFDPQIVNALAADGNGDLLVAGEFSGTLEFGGAPRTSTGGRDGYLVRLDAEGHEAWLQPLGGMGYQAGTSVAAGVNGRVVAAGRFSGTLAIGAVTYTSAGGNDVFAASFDAEGALLWSERFGDGFDQRARAVAVDAQENAIVAGEFAGAIDFGGGPIESAGDYDVFVAKLDPDGKHVWSRRFGDAGAQRALAIAVDGAGAVLVGGAMVGTVDFGGGARNAGAGEAVFVAKLDAEGEHVWSRRIGEQGASLGQVVVDGVGNVLVVGSFRGEARIGRSVLMSAGEDDAFVVKLDRDGEVVWARRFGGAGEDRGTGVAIDLDGAAVVTGAFSGSVAFGETSLDSGAGADVFVAKLSP